MKTNIKNILKASLLSAFAFLSVGCNTDPEYYSTVAPEIFFTSQETVWQRFSRPLTHWKWHFATDTHRADVQSLGTDEIAIPTKGTDWYDGGQYQNMHWHDFRSSVGFFHSNFYGVGMGVALAYDALEDIDNYVDFEALKFADPEGTKQSMIAQLNTIIAHLYMDGLDQFGGMNIYTREEAREKIVKGRATDKETFDFVEKLLKENIDKLPKKQAVNESETSMLKQAFGASLLAQLYFNANAYIGKEMWAECAAICKDILDGKYGPYKLGENWNDVFKWNNYTCGEIIAGVPSNETYAATYGAHWARWTHYNTNQYMGGTSYGAWNGFCIQPSLKPDGTPYTEFKLGKAFSKFHEKDLRKKPYSYLGDGEYEGMFLYGQQVSPSPRNPAGPGQTGEFKNGKWTGWVCMGNRTYSGTILYINDMVARHSMGNLNEEVDQSKLVAEWDKDGKPYDKNGNLMSMDTFKYLRSTMADGEENSGVRLVKYSVLVDKIDYDNLAKRCPAMYPLVRLAEIYYMLAECEYRLGNKARAAELFNTVRARNFEGGIDPDPVTPQNLDKYRFLDEWLVEFLGEKRRRTDLIRWGAYVHEDWWDHKATHEEYKNRFPISDSAISSNNLLEQNPGY